MKIIGKLVKVLDVVSGETDRGMWYRGGLVLESMDGNSRYMPFTVYGNVACSNIAQLAIGSTIQLDFVIEGRELGSRWYVDLKAYNIIVLTSARP